MRISRFIKLFGSTKRTEWLEQASAEASVTTQSIASQLVMQIEPLKRKTRSHHLKRWCVVHKKGDDVIAPEGTGKN